MEPIRGFPDEDVLTSLANRLQVNDPTALAEVFTRFLEPLMRVAHEHLDKRLRACVDPEDVVLSAFRSFFERLQAGTIQILEGQKLWSMLTVITVRKCIREARTHFKQSADRRRQISMDDHSSGAIWEIPDAATSPEIALEFQDVITSLRERLTNPIHQRILDLTLEGFSVGEISERLNYYDRGVERGRARIRELLRSILRE